MNDREKLRRIYDKLYEIRDIKYEDLSKRRLYRTKEEIYDILIGRKRNDRETIFINNKSRYQETIF